MMEHSSSEVCVLGVGQEQKEVKSKVFELSSMPQNGETRQVFYLLTEAAFNDTLPLTLPALIKSRLSNYLFTPQTPNHKHQVQPQLITTHSFDYP